MRRMLWVLGLALVGCGGETCEVELATRCSDDDVAERCYDGHWEVRDDCAADGEVCMQGESMGDGLAHCMPADMNPSEM